MASHSTQTFYNTRIRKIMTEELGNYCFNIMMMRVMKEQYQNSQSLNSSKTLKEVRMYLEEKHSLIIDGQVIGSETWFEYARNMDSHIPDEPYEECFAELLELDVCSECNDYKCMLSYCNRCMNPFCGNCMAEDLSEHSEQHCFACSAMDSDSDMTDDEEEAPQENYDCGDTESLSDEDAVQFEDDSDSDSDYDPNEDDEEMDDEEDEEEEDEEEEDEDDEYYDQYNQDEPYDHENDF